MSDLAGKRADYNAWAPGFHAMKRDRVGKVLLSPESLFASILFVFVTIHLLTMDRGGLLDNEQYIDYFANGDIKNWIWIFQFDSWLGIISLISEEIGWRFFTWLVSSIFAPEQSVYFTVFLINLLIFITISHTRNPFLGYFLWLFIPQGLPVTGLYQIRQGLGFSIFIYGMTSRRPVVFALLAAMIHTTLALPLLFLIMKSMSDRINKWYLDVFGVFCISLMLSFVGAELFNQFGGRRLTTYDVDEGASSIFFAIGNAILAGWYLLAYLKHKKANNRFNEIMAFMGFGISSFVTFAFFIFPLGTARVAYFSFLFAIPIAADLSLEGFKRHKLYGLFTLLVFAFLFYQSIKTAIAGGYAGLIFGSNI